ncbi:extracellular solute-binding protein [Nocardioides sp.]|jgi:multiple sugar transport system substrate-binding protein|uniref:extracellular solute-binding protein n=1 Tax=Nocardioides sp. TaxID=35761 RepID=UPI002CC3FCF1|nr:extracellular solute-binding protein [Nocardioides sp.]HVX53736.1 extracellular solute-binding protein [Nocardioides sp.]
MTRARGRGLAACAAAALATTTLAACGSSSGRAEIIWYTNPDNGGQAALAKDCSTPQYKITTQILPQDATQQRVQLARRLNAHDDSIDLMSLDPAYTAELANAGYLATIPAALQATLKQQSFKGAVAASSWDGKLAVAPFWSNTQVLWYKKSVAQKAGLDMSKPVTWDQIIDAAVKTHTKVGVQANKYEGYVVWINALVEGAGGDIVSDLGKGDDAKVDLDSTAGREAAAVIAKLAHSSAAPPDLSIAQEGQSEAAFAASNGGFLTNWTYIYSAHHDAMKDDLGYARFPETVAGTPSRPPYGGIGIGVSKYSKHIDLDMAAVKCLTSPTSQGKYAVAEGNMPASPAGYAYPALTKAYPADLLALFQESVNDAGPRPETPYWSDISGAIQSTWHPPASVNSGTPAKSASFIDDVLHGRSLL